MTPEQREERRKRMEERLAAMTPEERKAFEERMAARGGGRGGFGGPGGGGGDQGQGGGRGGYTGGRGGAPDQTAGANSRQSANAQSAAPGSQRGRVANTPSMTTGATTIDSLFGPLPTVETRGRAWLWVNKQLKPVSLRLGISDGANTEIISGEGVEQGTEVVTSIILPDAQTTTPGANANNPLMGPQRGRGGPGGGGGGGGRGGRG